MQPNTTKTRLEEIFLKRFFFYFSLIRAVSYNVSGRIASDFLSEKIAHYASAFAVVYWNGYGVFISETN